MSISDGIIELRSDTFTKPTPEMLAAMMKAEVGDDVYGEDPTVNILQEMAAEVTGQEAGLFVTSGTMGNLVALLTHCQRSNEVILGTKCHIFNDEAGGMAGFAGLQPRVIPNQKDGTLSLEDIENSIRPDDIHNSRTRLVCLENTQNVCGGIPLSVEYTQKISSLVRKHNLKLHIDGARLFNAAIAEGVTPSKLAQPADSVMFCLSKGLCAPVGSMLCGSQDFIAEAKRYRKELGGGMRQAGYLAAAGIVALQTMPQRLWEDHENARRLATGLQDIRGIEMDTAEVKTNMLYFNLKPSSRMSAEQLVQEMKKRGIMITPDNPHRFRLVTHYWVSEEDIDIVIQRFREVL